MNKHVAVTVLFLLAVNFAASQSQTTARPPARRTTTTRAASSAAGSPSVAEQLRQTLQAQQQQQQQIQQLQRQIQQLQQQLQERDQQVQQAQQTAGAANTKAEGASARASDAASTQNDLKATVASLDSTVTDLKANGASVAQTIQEDQKKVSDLVEHPDAIHFKGVTISPTGSFLAAETVYRTRGMGADVNTQLSGVPFSGATNGHLSEFNFSGRQSRLALLGEGKIGSLTARGYYEADFLSAGVTSNNNQSNSYTFRQRQAWGQAEMGSWTVTGGQMWSLVTETRSGLSNRTEVLPQTIDAQYTAGFSWARQYGLRVVKSVGKKFWIGGAVEEAQTLNPGGGGLPFTAVFQQVGNTGGLYNNQANYSYNLAPDLIGKVAIEPGYGHYEVFGILRFFRDRVYPNATGSSTSGAGAFNDTQVAGGIGGNARFALVPKKLDLGLHILAGDGVGRYGNATLADVTFRPNGTLSPIRGGSALLGLELHATPKLEVYAYYGGDYDARQIYTAVIGGKLTQIGYGRTTNNTSGCGIEVAPLPASVAPLASSTATPANCSPDNRLIQEGSVGYWYDFYRGPKGRLRQSIQYSYLEKNTWQGTGGSPKAIDNMIFTSFRYYLP
jgi:hypothetical protein